MRYLNEPWDEEIGRTIVATVINGIIVINDQGVIQFFNPAAEKIFGFMAEEVLEHNVNILMSEPHQSRHDAYMAAYLQSGIKKIIGIGREVEGLRKNGETFPLELAVSEMTLGNERKFVGIITDITERKLAEELIKKSNQLKSEFLNIMSHELRTPLTVLLGNIPLLTDPEDLPAPEEIAEIARDIEHAGRHLLTLINDLLDISKIEAGKMALSPRRISAREVGLDVVNSFQMIAKEKGLQIHADLPDVDIYADPIRLKQVLFNLLGNAVKFTTFGTIVLQVTPGDGVTLFSVIDTGCGIAQKDIPYIFDVFRQVDSSETRSAGGTGLGLTITKRLVEMHGGHIWVESDIERGSTFTFSIPEPEMGDHARERI